MGRVLMPSNKTWFTWTSEAAFDAWHTVVVHALHLPRVGQNAKTGTLQPEAQQTIAYTAVIEVGVHDWRAPIEQWVASDYPTGLGNPSEPPPPPEDL